MGYTQPLTVLRRGGLMVAVGIGGLVPAFVDLARSRWPSAISTSSVNAVEEEWLSDALFASVNQFLSRIMPIFWQMSEVVGAPSCFGDALPGCPEGRRTPGEVAIFATPADHAQVLPASDTM